MEPSLIQYGLLDRHRDKFERDHEDVFEASCLSLGKLTSLEIKHDGKGFKNSDWHLEKVTVIDDSNNQTEFPCKLWLSKKEQVYLRLATTH